MLRPRPLTVGDTLDGAIQVLRAAWPTGILAIAILIGAVTAVTGLLTAPLLLELSRFDPLAPGADPFDVLDDLGAAFAVAFVGVALLSFLATVAAEVSALWAVREREAGGSPRVGGALAYGVRRAPGLLLVLVVQYLALVAGVLVVVALVAGSVAVAPGLAFLTGPLAFAAVVLLGPAWFGHVLLVPACAVIEDRGVWPAFGRSLRLIGRRFWRVVGIIWLMGLIAIVLGIGVGIVTAPLGFLPEALAVGSFVVQQLVTQLITVPILAGVGAMLLVDASARVDGADLTARAQGLGGGPSAGATGGWGPGPHR